GGDGAGHGNFGAALIDKGYQALLERDDIDAVYIPLPTSMRKPWVLAAAAAGKHVLCEKPVADTVADAQEMIDTCAQAGVQFMDGVMFSHSARLNGIRNALENPGTLGRLRRINTSFCFSGDQAFQTENIRVDSRLERHGCLGDLGWYTLRMTLWVMQYRMPNRVIARTLTSLQGNDSPEPVPGEFSAELFYDADPSAPFGIDWPVTATMYNSFLTENQQLVAISGDQGYVTLDDFVLPFYDAEMAWYRNAHVVEIDNCRWNIRRHTKRQCVQEYPGGEANSQEVRMFRTFGENVLSSTPDPHWPEITLKTQTLLNACRESADANGKVVEFR
ncbi:MAG: Gfo/Idh/MocA family oxidoreductase, partial [Planctomycetota bacterium]